MKTSTRCAAIGLLAAAASMPLLAGEREHGTRTHAGDRSDQGMQTVPNHAGRGEPGHGWRYFSDPAAARAVVVSPRGEYYYSRGHGLRPVAPTEPGS